MAWLLRQLRVPAFRFAKGLVIVSSGAAAGVGTLAICEAPMKEKDGLVDISKLQKWQTNWDSRYEESDFGRCHQCEWLDDKERDTQGAKVRRKEAGRDAIHRACQV